MPIDSEPTRVLAIGIDAAETSLVRRLVDDGRLPALAALARQGRWSAVHSSAGIGSGTVWPSLLTGTPPDVHGVYSEWLWDPAAMQLVECRARPLEPFWADLHRRGATVGVLDVPFASPVGLDAGFEISEWGAHDVLEGRMRVAPAPAADVVAAMPAHPYASPQDLGGLDGPARREAVTAASDEGIRRRGDLALRLLEETGPDLALIVFPELHHAGHLLWPTGVGTSGGGELVALYEAVDREVGRLVSAWPEPRSVAVFALHGMAGARGIPSLLPEVLRATGAAARPGWRKQSWRSRALSLYAGLKRRAPAWAQAAYRRHAHPSLRITLARPTMLAAHDWSRTTAFALPSDQHGWVRVNLSGRERDGCVDVDDYERVCADVEHGLLSLEAPGGETVVADVVRTAATAGDALRNLLPDLVVHWGAGAYADDVVATAGAAPTSPQNPWQTGAHTETGFCISTGAIATRVADDLTVEDLSRALAGGLGRH